jgi:hypothetical protein
MDLEVGGHSCAPSGGFSIEVPYEADPREHPPPSILYQCSSATDPDTSALPCRFAALPRNERIPLPYQAPPHLVGWGHQDYPYIAAVISKPRPSIMKQVIESSLKYTKEPEKSNRLAALCPIDSSDPALRLVLQSRIYDGQYVFLGEADMNEIHEHHHLEHICVGVSAFPAKEAETMANDLGQVLAEIHFGLDLDGFGFAVVHGHLHLEEEEKSKLWVVNDYARCRRLFVDVDPEVVDRLAFVLGRMAYVPSPEQENLFSSFSKGYMDKAEEFNQRHVAKSVLLQIKEFTD